MCRFFQQLVLGMDYAHRKGMVLCCQVSWFLHLNKLLHIPKLTLLAHAGVMSRDIKLENTLLVLQPDKKPLLKLCDFGYSKHDTLDSVAKSKVGTPGYTAPGRLGKGS